MATQLATELRKFAGYSTILRNNYRETRLATHDLKAGSTGPVPATAANVAGDSGIASNASSTTMCGAAAGAAYASQSASAAAAADFLELTRVDENVIRQTIDARPALIVLGTSFQAKARVVNELFRKNVMPLASHPTSIGTAGMSRTASEAGDIQKPKTFLLSSDADRRRCSSANTVLCGQTVHAETSLATVTEKPDLNPCVIGAREIVDNEQNYFYRIVRFYYRPRYACGLTQISCNANTGNLNDVEFQLSSSIPRTLTNSSITDRRGSFFRQKVNNKPVSAASHNLSESPTQITSLSSANDERAGTISIHMLRVAVNSQQAESTCDSKPAGLFQQATTIVDVGISHPLLKEGWRIIVGASVPSYQHRSGDEDPQQNADCASGLDKKDLVAHNIQLLVERFASHKTNSSLPIFIYAIDCAFLDAQHQNELNTLRNMVGKHKLAVLFVRMSVSRSDDSAAAAAKHDDAVQKLTNLMRYEHSLADQYYRKSVSASRVSNFVDRNNVASLLRTVPSSSSDDCDDTSTSPSTQNKSVVRKRCLTTGDILAPCTTHAGSYADNSKAADVDSGCEQYSSSSTTPAVVSTAELLKMQLYNLGYQFFVRPSSSSFFSSTNAETASKAHGPTICGDPNCCRVWCHEQLVDGLGVCNSDDSTSGGQTKTTRRGIPAGAADALRRHHSKKKASPSSDTTATGAAAGLTTRRVTRKSRRQLRVHHSGSSTASSSSCSHTKRILDTYTHVYSLFVDANVTKPAIGASNVSSGNSSSAVSSLSSSIVIFVRKAFQAHLVRASTTLNDFQEKCLLELTHVAFDVTREASVLPQRLQFVQEQEAQLYNSLNNVVLNRQEEVQRIVCEAIASMREQLLLDDDVEQCSNGGSRCASPTVIKNGRRSPVNVVVEPKPAAAVCANQIRAIILKRLNNAVAARILERVRCVRESFTGTLKRCLAKLEERTDDLLLSKNGLPSIAALSSAASSINNLAKFNDDEYADSNGRRSKNSTNAAMPRGKQVNAIVDNVLRRAQQQQGDSTASSALEHVLNAAYSLELNAENSTSKFSTFKQRFMKSFAVTSRMWKPISCSSGGGTVTPVSTDIRETGLYADDAEWRRQIAVDFLSGLSTERVSRLVCQQFQTKLRDAHELFLTSLRQLEMRLLAKLERADKTKRVVRKVHAPRMARLALESHSLRDTVLFGIPQPGRELGRGQYGVVHACEAWAGRSPCAVKSVVPPDERHQNDLALEIFYTKSVLPHPRLVQIYGSVMDYGYGDSDLASGPSVLIVMERLPRDLYHALKRGCLNWPKRLQIALDVIEGIRYLHGRGFIHRDIKLKNVLLDERWRAKLTDFGFCKPNSLISGSVVGTPIHMAPEVFCGGLYGNSVDIYAFGVLYWFVCAGRVRLPQAFEPWMSRDLLRSSVKRGVRPERLPEFDDDSWALMQACWAPQAEQRPLPGDVEGKLRDIQQWYNALAQSRRSASLAGAGNAHHHVIPNGSRGLSRVRQRDVLLGDAGSTPYVEIDLTTNGNENNNNNDAADDATPKAGNLLHMLRRSQQQQQRDVRQPSCDEVDGYVGPEENMGDGDKFVRMRGDVEKKALAINITNIDRAKDRKNYYYTAAEDDDLANLITPT